MVGPMMCDIIVKQEQSSYSMYILTNLLLSETCTAIHYANLYSNISLQGHLDFVISLTI